MGLFSDHKLIFSLFMSAGIEMRQGTINENQWKFFLLGNDDNMQQKSSSSLQPMPADLASFVSVKQWELIHTLEIEYAANMLDVDSGAKHPFSSFGTHISVDQEEWKEYTAGLNSFQGSGGSYFDDIPNPFSYELTTFELLMIVKIFKPERLVYAIKEYVKD